MAIPLARILTVLTFVGSATVGVLAKVNTRKTLGFALLSSGVVLFLTRNMPETSKIGTSKELIDRVVDIFRGVPALPEVDTSKRTPISPVPIVNPSKSTRILHDPLTLDDYEYVSGYGIKKFMLTWQDMQNRGLMYPGDPYNWDAFMVAMDEHGYPVPGGLPFPEFSAYPGFN